MLISVNIPVYNEKATIQEIVRRVEEQPFEKEPIVVDDGSKDGKRVETAVARFVLERAAWRAGETIVAAVSGEPDERQILHDVSHRHTAVCPPCH
jgi:cellulose synthase/poly-beta-1,6-N-acetylglucosamine synthase-like glycosyltransferase